MQPYNIVLFLFRTVRKIAIKLLGIAAVMFISRASRSENVADGIVVGWLCGFVRMALVGYSAGRVGVARPMALLFLRGKVGKRVCLKVYLRAMMLYMHV